MSWGEQQEEAKKHGLLRIILDEILKWADIFPESETSKKKLKYLIDSKKKVVEKLQLSREYFAEYTKPLFDFPSGRTVLYTFDKLVYFSHSRPVKAIYESKSLKGNSLYSKIK